MLKITPNTSFTHNAQNNENVGLQNLLSSSLTPIAPACLGETLLIKRIFESKEIEQGQKKVKRTYSQESKDTRRLWELSNKDKKSAQNRAYNAKYKKEIDEHAKIYYAINKNKIESRKKSRREEIKAKKQGSEEAKKGRENTLYIENLPQYQRPLIGQTPAPSLDNTNSITGFLNDIFDNSGSDFSNDGFFS